MSRKYMKKAEFARHCNITPTSVHLAIKDKRISVSASGFVDANHPKNIQFYERQQERQAKAGKAKSDAKLYSERTPEHRPKFVPADDPEGELDPGDYDSAGLDASMSEIDYAIEKMKSTTAINKARLAEMVKATVRRDFVDRVISLIGTAISDHLITMGDRLSPELAALAGSTEASVIRVIKQTLDVDVSAALREMQLVIEKHYQAKLEE